MHEAGIARAIAAQIRERGTPADSVRILVTGGHDEPAAFDDSLRFHLAAELPALDVRAIEIVHKPEMRLCRDCATPFMGPPDAGCPVCGGLGLAVPAPERVELEWRGTAARGSRRARDGAPARS